MAISASQIATSNTLENFRQQFNNLQTDVNGLESGTLTFSTVSATTTSTSALNILEDGTIVFEGATDDGYETTLTVTDPTADRTITLPNATGTVALTGASSFTVADAGTIGSASDTDAIAISSAGVVSFSATTANTNATDGAVTIAGGLGVALDASIGDDLRLISDAAVLSFGTNSEITLTHVHDTGLLLEDSGGSPTLQFHDSNESISSDGTNLILTSGGTAFTFPTSDGTSGQFLKTDASGNLSFATQAGNAADDITTGDGAVTIATTSGNITIDAQANDSDITFKGTDGTVDTTFLTIDGSDAGTASFNHDVKLANDGAVLGFGADNEVSFTHVHNTGLQVTGNLVMLGTSSAAASIDFREDTDNGTNAITVIAPASTADETVMLPDNSGTLPLRDAIIMDASDGSATDAGDDLVQNTSANDGHRLLLEDAMTGDTSGFLTGHDFTFSGSNITIGGDLSMSDDKQLKFGSSKWTVESSSSDNDLDFKYNGTTVFKIASNGAITSDNDVTAFGNP